MRISACYIVKNEVKTLARSIESLQRAVDEIIVVDTGSTDGTQELARSLGARVLSYAWQDDFAAARNYALNFVTGEWVIFLDADEYFRHPENLRYELEKLLTHELDAIMVKLYHIDGAVENGATYPFRIFRNCENLRYVGRIHEVIARTDGEKLNLITAGEELSCNHTGYSSDIISEKVQRNLHLLEKDLAEGRETWSTHYHLMDCYYGRKDYLCALREAYICLARGVEAVRMGQMHILHIAIESLRQIGGDPKEMLRLAEAGWREYPALPEFYGERGMILSAMGEYEKARSLLLQAVHLYEQPIDSERTRVERYFTKQSAGTVYARLAELCLLEGGGKKKITEARAWLRKAERVASALPFVRRVAEEIHQKYGKILLTACYIVKNEEKNLKRSLESLVGVDEIVVVDTGSTDGTKQVAEAFGARIFDVPWEDDFAKARNFALEAALGEWIVFLDADEYFSEETRGNLPAVLTGAGEVLVVPLRNYDEDTGEILLDIHVSRIFKNKPELRYEGRIHEELRAVQADEMRVLSAEELLILHTGYSAKRSEEKARRNLKLLQEAVLDGDDELRLAPYLAESYEGIGELSAAAFYARLFIRRGRRGTAFDSRAHRILLRILAAHGATEEQKRVAGRAVQDFPEIPEFHAEYAEYLAREGAYSAALREADKALELFSYPAQTLEPIFFSKENAVLLAGRKALWKARAEV